MQRNYWAHIAQAKARKETEQQTLARLQASLQNLNKDLAMLEKR